MPQVQQSSLNQILDRLNQKFLDPPLNFHLELHISSKHFFFGGGGGGGAGLIEKGGLKERGRLISFSKMHQREQGFSRTDLWLPGAILLFLTIRISSSEKGRLIREGGGGA